MTTTNATWVAEHIHDDSGSGQMYAVACVTFTIALLIVGARFATRRFLVGSFGLDDILIAIAIAASCALTATIKLQINAGVGRRAATLTLVQLSMVNKVAWISQMIYYFTITFVKLSILALYLRLAPKGRYRTAMKIIFAFVAAQGSSCVFGTMFMCTPITAVWNVETFPAGCIDILHFNFFNASFGIFIDVVLALLPIPLLLELQVNMQKKIGLAIVFSFGLIAIAGTIGRLASTITWSNSPDFTWTFTPILLWTAVECNVAIISASLPSLRPLFKQMLDVTGSKNSSFGKSGNRSGGKSADRSSSHRLEDMSSKKSGYTTDIRSVDHKASRITSNDSEESIVRFGASPSTTPSNEKVVKTVEYRIEYD